ncbi:MAG: ABC transporter substrate-binding protein [Bacteroidales bacterium]|nr:ABC transporter substrate-binding protein [Bacteroidales bacterium]
MQKTFIDHLNRKILVNFPPKRIISLVPSISELIYDLDLDKELVGITRYCIHPGSLLKEKTIVGGTENVDIKLINSLKPDLILANKEENSKNEIEKLLNTPIFVSNIRTFDEALSFIIDIGELTDRQKNAENIVSQILDKFNNFKAIQPSKSVAYLVWKEPFITINRNTFINDMLEKAGFSNVFSHKPESYPKISLEEIAKAKPEYIFLSSEPYPFTNKHIIEYEKMFPNSKILKVDGEIFAWYGSHLIKATDYFKQLL